MKNFFKCFTVIFFAINIIACSSSKSIEEKIAGTYSLNQSSSYGTITWTYEFKEDGTAKATVSLSGQSKSTNGSWRIENSKIYTSFDDDNPEFTFEEDGDNITIYFSGTKLRKE